MSSFMKYKFNGFTVQKVKITSLDRFSFKLSFGRLTFYCDLYMTDLNNDVILLQLPGILEQGFQKHIVISKEEASKLEGLGVRRTRIDNGDMLKALAS
jgi:hypothetical protein